MFNFVNWYKEGFEFPKGGEAFMDAVKDIFKKNEDIVQKASMSVTFENGAKLVVRMAKDIAEKTSDKVA